MASAGSLKPQHETRAKQCWCSIKGTTGRGMGQSRTAGHYCTTVWPNIALHLIEVKRVNH